jgi:hypothetical protein
MGYWQWIILVEEAEVCGESNWPDTNKLYHISTPYYDWSLLISLVVMGTDCIGKDHSHDSTYFTKFLLNFECVYISGRASVSRPSQEQGSSDSEWQTVVYL